ncbi:MAG: flavodoxin family protein [Thermoguttaceae bacterium]|nr:flavodoxin family protein [Thermoguttaceae bacterium]
MKVLLVNGSPHQKGATFTGLSEVAKTLNEEGIETDFYWIGVKPIGGCVACARCREKKACVFDDKVNEFTELAAGFDGFVYGSPVYYAGINGSFKSFLDRVFFSSASKTPHPFRFKPCASIVCARRAGTTSALDQLNKYLLYHQGPVVASRYWCMVHGNSAEDAAKDIEGLQIMRALGRNMAWVLKSIEAGKKAGIPLPTVEEWTPTNFIR